MDSNIIHRCGCKKKSSTFPVKHKNNKKTEANKMGGGIKEWNRLIQFLFSYTIYLYGTMELNRSKRSENFQSRKRIKRKKGKVHHQPNNKSRKKDNGERERETISNLIQEVLSWSYECSTYGILMHMRMRIRLIEWWLALIMGKSWRNETELRKVRVVVWFWMANRSRITNKYANYANHLFLFSCVRCVRRTNTIHWSNFFLILALANLNKRV